MKRENKLEHSSAIAIHIPEAGQHVYFVNLEILSKYWPIYRDRINAEQWFISNQLEAFNLKGKTTHQAWNQTRFNLFIQTQLLNCFKRLFITFHYFQYRV